MADQTMTTLGGVEMSAIKRAVTATAIVTTIVAGMAGAATRARAAFIVNVLQDGSNVVATGSGTLDLTDLSFDGTISNANLPSAIRADGGLIYTGATGTSVDVYTGFSGPGTFGSGGLTTTNSHTGDFVGLVRAFDLLYVFAGYGSGNSLSDSAEYDNTTFSDLGVIPGSYVWTWGSGTHADSFTLNIDTTAAVPEPSSMAVLAAGLVGFGFFRRRRKIM